MLTVALEHSPGHPPVGSASSHLISFHFFVGGNVPSHTITPRCNRVHKSRYTAPAPLDSQDRHKAAAQQRAGALQSHHPGCNSTLLAPARTPSGAPSHEGAVDGTAEAPDQQVARRTRSRTDTSHYNRLQHGSRSDATATPPMVKGITSNVLRSRCHDGNIVRTATEFCSVDDGD